MKAWSALVIVIVLTAAYLLNNAEEKPTDHNKTVSEIPPSPARKIEEPKASAREARLIKEVPKEDEDVASAVEETPRSIAQPEGKLEPQPLVAELPLWTPPKPKAHDDMWTLREVRKADMSDRTLLLITYGQEPRPNFRVEAWEPDILAPNEH